MGPSAWFRKHYLIRCLRCHPMIADVILTILPFLGRDPFIAFGCWFPSRPFAYAAE